jgi:hypothetical protein
MNKVMGMADRGERGEDADRMGRAQRLRVDLVHALRRQDWSWLGLAR